MKKIVIIFIGIFSALYLLNPSAGIFEILPDNIPLIGNLDEATATTLLIAALGYFGIDASKLFKRSDKIRKITSTKK